MSRGGAGTGRGRGGGRGAPDAGAAAGRGGGRAPETPGGASPWIAAAFLGGAAGLSLLFYGDFVFQPGRMLFGTDMVDQAYQLRQFAVEEIRQGRGLPLWNPYVYGGVPYLAILPGPVFYPTSLLYLLLPLHRAIGWTFVLHTFLAGSFAYFAARSFRLSRPSAAACGVSFMLSGYFLSHLYGGHDGRMFAMALIPLALGCLERGLARGSVGWSLAAAGAVALQILTPHVQVMYFSSLLLVLYAGFRLTRRARREGAGVVGRGAGLVALIFAAAALLGAVQLLPTYALLGHAVRGTGEGGYAFAASWALPPQELTALFLPDLMGSLGGYWGRNPFKLHTEYLGAVPLALAALAVASSLGDGPLRERRATVWFLAGAAGLGTLFALGEATPVHRLAYAVVPLIRSFRAPSMMLAPVALLVALLAGFGWEAVRRGRRTGAEADPPRAPRGAGGRPSPEGVGDGGIPWGWLWLFSAPVLLLGLAAAAAPTALQDFAYHSWLPAGWPRRPSPELASQLRAGGALLLGAWLLTLAAAAGVTRGRVGEWAILPVLLVLVVDLSRVDARYLQTANPADFFAADPTILRLRDALGPGERVWPLEDTYRPNELMYFRIPAVTGSQNFRLEWYERLVGGLGYDNLLRNPVLWGLFDIRFLTARSELETPLLRGAWEAGGARVYEVADPVPHAYFPSSVRAVRDTAEALRRTLGLRHALEEAVVEATTAPSAGAGTAALVEWTPDRLTLSVEAERGGLLVVSEVWAPGWRAAVDGREAPVLRANTAFRAVHVPAGEHELRLWYAPPAVRWGSRLSAAALAALAVAAAALGLRRLRGAGGGGGVGGPPGRGRGRSRAEGRHEEEERGG